MIFGIIFSKLIMIKLWMSLNDCIEDQCLSGYHNLMKFDRAIGEKALKFSQVICEDALGLGQFRSLYNADSY